ncbi:glycosyl hydrolase [Gordonia sp. AC31]|uniref:glycoside hydrolase family 26 protein n=1 Tax=Gordonia sp. AC31 TaxID=2962571 RepID=UPI002881F1E5|nr:glycosyl hydrolase [Gordonia sp. AC31]MDT0223421.1 glycosyl hydrolase [Gordonia sp. AC31]
MNGNIDHHLQRWGRGLAAWGKPILVRIAHEMNGDWYPWSIGVDRNTTAEYRAAFRRMRTIIKGEGAHQASFVWSPNVLSEGTRGFMDCYPGDDVVDYVGLDGYNWGDTPGHQWQSVRTLFPRSLSLLRQVAPTRPVLITEVGCANGSTAEDKSRWISDFFSFLEQHQSVLGFVWFQTDKERDWRINSTPASTQAFRDGLANWIRS